MQAERLKTRYRPDNAAPLLELFRWWDAEYGGDPAWLRQARRDAADAVERLGLPTPKLERWAYTNIQPLAKDYGAGVMPPGLGIGDPDGLVKKLSGILPDAPDWLVSMLTERGADADRYGDAMLRDVNAMFLRDGLVVDVPEGRRVEKPVDITVSGAEGGFYTPHAVVRLGRGAELTIIERHDGKERHWVNGLSRIIVGPDAILRRYGIQETGAGALATRNSEVTVERGGAYESMILMAGEGLVRDQSHIRLAGENASCRVFGLTAMRGGGHGDMTVEIEHTAPGCRSEQLARSVLDDRAHGVFQGKAYVHRGADGADARQLSNALLLHEGAEMDTKPELEIYADDVKCSHGATTGRLDDAALFYMRSRGVPEDEARGLLIAAFVDEVVDKAGDEAVKALFHQKIREWIGGMPRTCNTEGAGCL